MRESAVGEYRTEPTFVASSQTKRKAQRANPNSGERVIAMRAEFVVKPGKEDQVRNTIDLVLHDSFGREKEFLQALVLVSEQESRLMTVITFWRAQGFAEARERRVRWLQQKLTPELDQTFRVQSYCAHLLETSGASTTDPSRDEAEEFEFQKETAVACVS